MEDSILNLEVLENLVAKAKELEEKTSKYRCASDSAESACYAVWERIKDSKARDAQHIADLEEAIPQTAGAKRALLEAQLHGLQEQASCYLPTDDEKQFFDELISDATTSRHELRRTYEEMKALRQSAHNDIDNALKGILGTAWNLCGDVWKTKEERTQEAFDKLYNQK